MWLKRGDADKPAGTGFGRSGEMTVDLPQGLRVSFEDQPSAEDCDAIGYALDAYNREFLGETGYSRMGVFVRNERGEIMAGLVGSTYAGWLYVADLWVHAELRRRGIGRELLAMAERRAVELGCHSVRLETLSFQAPEYYPSVLDGVAIALPALLRAAKIQGRAARIGFDWPAARPVIAKIAEEIAELEAELDNS